MSYSKAGDRPRIGIILGYIQPVVATLGSQTTRRLAHYANGYFERYYEALDFAKTLNVDKVYDCEFCHPRYSKETVQEKKEAES